MRRSDTRRNVVKWTGLLALGSAGCIASDSTEDDDGGNNATVNRSTDGESDPEPDPEPGNEEEEDTVIDLVDDFEDLSVWDVLDGSVVGDSEVHITGSQSARIDIENDHLRGLIARSFDSPLSVSDIRPHLAVRSEETVYPRIRLVDADGDHVEFRASVGSEVGFQRFDFGISDTDGDPDLSAVESVEFDVFVGSDDSLRLWVDDLRISRAATPGIVLIHFDDALETDYTEAFPILNERDMVASTFVNPGYLGRTVGGSPRLSLDQLGALDDAGWDVCSHGMRHTNLANASGRERVKEVRDAHHWLRDHGFESGADYFVYPYSAYDQEAIDVVGEYHDMAFVGGWPAVGRATNPHLVPRATGEPSFEEAKRDIDLTAAYGGVTTLFYHELSGDQLEDFERTIAYLDERRTDGTIDVMSVRELDSNFSRAG